MTIQAGDADPTDKVDAAFQDLEEVSDDISDVSWTDIPVLIIFWLLFGIVLLQFITRYVFNDSYGWTEEIARYFLIFLCFVGSITCVRKGSHIYLEFFYRYLPAGAIKIVSMLVEATVAVFFAYAGYLGIGLAQRTFAQKMVSIDLPKGLIYWIVVVSCFAMALAALINTVRLARRPATEVAARRLGENPAGRI